jgi:DNA repair exonuclease SbcCD ATPase subunit
METAPSNAIVEYKATEAAIADIQRFKGLVVDVTNPSGLAQGKSALREVAAVRIALDKTRKKLKEDVLERGRQIDGQAKPLFARVAEIEDPIKAQIEAEERREEETRQAAIKAEEERLAAIERERKEAEARELAEARAKIEAERKRIADERAKLEAEQKAAREKAEAEERARLNRIAEEDRARQAKIDEAERASKQRIAEPKRRPERSA